MLTREELIFLLHKACTLLVQAAPDTRPDWAEAIANANPPMIESALEVARDTYTYDETGEV
jgi:hypothetical protein